MYLLYYKRRGIQRIPENCEQHHVRVGILDLSPGILQWYAVEG